MPQQEDLLYQVALTMVQNIGAVSSKNLFAYCGSAQEVFRQKKAHLLKIPGIGPTSCANILEFKDFKIAEKELAFIEKHNIKPLLFLDKEYPQRLKDIEDAPFLMYYKGNGSLNVPKMIALVGTRKASEYGKAICEKLVEELKEYNATVVSGLAYGIDHTAHKASVKHGLSTIGVMANGLDIMYPSAHRSLGISMLELGGILTEYPSGALPNKERFPKRNRIVAGMTDAVVVVESPQKGGSLITAEIANSYNREVFAIPGRAGDEVSAGCNHYIKVNKAYLAEKASDIAYILGWDDNQKPMRIKTMPSDLTDTEKSIYVYLKDKDKADIDSLSYAVSHSSAELSMILLDLEFRGLIQALPGKCFRLLN